MLNNVYCMYDKVSEQYGPPILGINDLSLKRELKSMIIADVQSQNLGFLSKRSDLVIYKIGTYDTDKGVISSCNCSQVYTMIELYNEVISENKNSESLMSKGSKDGKENS